MRVLVAVLSLLLSLSAAAQKKQGQDRIDSLLAELPKMAQDTAGVKLLNWLATEYCNINPDEGLKYAAQELALAQKTGWRKGVGMAYNDFGLNYQYKGAYPAALDAFFKTLHTYEELGDKGRSGRALGNIGNIYWKQKNYPKALEYFFRSVKIAGETGDKKRMQLALGNIGSVYLEQGKNNEALEYQKKSLMIAEELNDKAGIINQTGNISGAYASMKEYPTALAYQFKALRMAEEIGDKQHIAINLGNIGETYYLIAKDSTATKPDTLVPAGKRMVLAKGIKYLNQGIAACREINFFEAIPEFSGALSEALALQGDHQGALAAYKQATGVKDSLYSIENNEKITNLETKRAIELKDKDIQIAKLAVAKKRNERVFFIAGIILLLCIMGILFRSFRRQQHSNKLLSKEKKRSDDLLLNILPAEVAEELKDKGASAARQYDEVSVLFTDFVDFTGTAEKLPPRQLVQELNEYFTAFDTIVERNGLEKIKTIGDAYLAVCGLPVSDPDHAKKAVQASLEIVDFIKDRKKKGRAFEVRIGVNSGPVVAGIVGVKKFAYDIWGDTVNTAARMEQNGEAGKVNISHATYQLVKNSFSFTPRGPIAAKHKGEIEMYFVAHAIAPSA